MLIELGGARLLTDPVLRSRVAHLRRRGAAPATPANVDAVLLSHLHYDHTDLPSLRRLAAAAPRLLAPRGAEPFLRRSGFDRIEELAPGEETDVNGARVRATPAAHDDRRRPFGPRAEPIGFVARSERSVYFAGDTDLFPGMAELGPVDVALVPVAGWGPMLGPGHLDAKRAAHAVELLRPRLAIPIHWGTLHPRGREPGAWFRDPPTRFAAYASELAAAVDVRILAPGESLAL